MKAKKSGSESGYLSLVAAGFLIWVFVFVHALGHQLRLKLQVHERVQVAHALEAVGVSALSEGIFRWYSGVVQEDGVTRRGHMSCGRKISEVYTPLRPELGWQTLAESWPVMAPDGSEWSVRWWVYPAGRFSRPEWQRSTWHHPMPYDWREKGFSWVDPEIGDKLRPVLAAAVLHIGVFHAAATADIRFRYHIEGILWNPYNEPVRFQRELHPVAPIGIEIEGLPRVALLNSTTGMTLFEIDLQDTLDHRWESGPWRAWVHHGFGASVEDVWLEPGEFLPFREPLQNQGLVRVLPAGLGRIALDPLVLDRSHGIALRVVAAREDVTINLRERNPSGSYGQVLFSANLNPWPGTTLDLDPDQFWLERSEDYRWGMRAFSYGFKLQLDEPGFDFWRRQYDLRSGSVGKENGGMVDSR
ncbi:MAG: hypothetical protein LR015_10660 [Verrucomicrobia bacterium]|nr:hypothetical protein [Verrucomicrobiota bacterium]